MINNVELLYNDKNEYIGFAGQVKVRDKDVFVDTRTGKGYDQVIRILGDMVGYLAGRFNFEGFTNDDNRQHVMLRMLEGIPKFNPNKDTKLSTFLQIRVSRLLINEVRDANRFCRNATTLNIRAYSYRCSCGNTFRASKSDDVKSCSVCGLPIDKNKRLWIRKSTVSLDGLTDGYLSTLPLTSDTGKKTAEIDLMSCIKDENPQVREIVCMMYFQGHTAKTIAEKLGITTTCVYNKLKALKYNRKLSELMRGGNNVYFG
jgi:RNA polymerase sigma factor (sigma-70 family)